MLAISNDSTMICKRFGVFYNGVHSLFFRRLAPRWLLDSLPVAIKDPLEDPILFRTAQGQHLAGVAYIPPGS
jgi:hypothetical protein